MTFQMPQAGGKKTRFQRLKLFISQFDENWPKQPCAVASEEIERIKREAHIGREICAFAGKQLLKGWPEEFQWYAENLGECGCQFNFQIDFTVYPISKNTLNKNRGHLPHLFIGQLGIDSYYLAYDYSENLPTPHLVWASYSETLFRAADTLEKLLFASAFLNYAFYEYEWQYKCIFPASISNSSSIDENAYLERLSQKYYSILTECQFQQAWFSTNTDQFFLKDDICFILSRDFDTDDTSHTLLGRMGSNNERQIKHLIQIMQSNGIICEKIWR